MCTRLGIDLLTLCYKRQAGDVCVCVCVPGGGFFEEAAQVKQSAITTWSESFFFFYNCDFFPDRFGAEFLNPLSNEFRFQLYIYSQRWKASEGPWAKNKMQSLYDLMETPSRREGKQRKCSGSGPQKDPYCALLFWFVGLCLHLHWPVLLLNANSHSTNVMLSAWQEIKVEPPSLRSAGNKITIVNPSETNKQINKGGWVGCQDNTHKTKEDINACEQTLA